MHGGTNPGAPRDNLNAYSSGRRMMEDAVAAKMSTVTKRAVYGMIRNTVTGFEKKLPAAEVRAAHATLLDTVATAEAVKGEARRQKRERLERHFGAQEQQTDTAPPDRKARRQRRKGRQRSGSVT
jgi:hypothetical protein